MAKLKFIDLCCGIGGFHQALTNMGMKCVLASDIDDDCKETYKNNYGIDVKGDLKDIIIKDIPKFNVLCAGFPCQPFSKSGHQLGFKDSRGNIFFDICKIVDYHKPEYLIFENVRNFAGHDKGNTWNVVKKTIRELGYKTYDDPLILNTLYFGIPQSRERVVILCKRNDMGELKELPTIVKKERIKPTSLTSIIQQNDKSNKITGRLKVTEKVWDEFLEILIKNNISVPKFPIWTDWWDSNGEGTAVTKIDKSKTDEENDEIIKKRQLEFYKKYEKWIISNRDFYEEHKSKLRPWLEKSRKQEKWKGAVRKMEWQTGMDGLRMNEVLWSPRGSGVRIKKIDYSPTLVAMASMTPIYGPLSRELTPRECARLQSFPDSFKINPNKKIAYKQFGNAVNVVMIEKSARFLIENKNLFN